ncbi:MAG: hypothetical protein BalsKO_17950 [Balneolaceae bacterium]
MSENRFNKYLAYAFGEIVLVVIGILIALQINNWNETRIQKQELNELLGSVANGIKSDIRTLNLMISARQSSKERADSLYSLYVTDRLTDVSIEQKVYTSISFTNLRNEIFFKPNLAAFESLNNSLYYSKIQGTDLETLLTAYYSTVEQIQVSENDLNQRLASEAQLWDSKFRGNAAFFVFNPWEINTDEEMVLYQNALMDPLIGSLFSLADIEVLLIPRYEELITLGKKFIEMTEEETKFFDQESKLQFSGILFSYTDADLISILINGKIPTNFELRSVISGILDDYESSAFIENSNSDDVNDGYVTLKYPSNELLWASQYFLVNALNGRVDEMDFSNYDRIFIEMKGNIGGEKIELAIKDKLDPPDGSESRVHITLTNQWKTYEIDLSEFETADLTKINVPLSFVFQGSDGMKIHLKSVHFR